MSFDGLFNTEAKDVKPEKLPTLAQFLKRNRQQKRLLTQKVLLIWLPGKFNNFTLQTEHCRVIVSPKHPLYGHLRAFDTAGNESNEIGFNLEITDWSEGSYMLIPHGRNGSWSELGKSGIVWNEP